MAKQLQNCGYTCADQILKIQGNAAGDQNTNRQKAVDWSRKVVAMSAIRTYEELAQYVNNHPLPAFNDQPNDAIAQ